MNKTDKDKSVEKYFCSKSNSFLPLENDGKVNDILVEGNLQCKNVTVSQGYMATCTHSSIINESHFL